MYARHPSLPVTRTLLSLALGAIATAAYAQDNPPPAETLLSFGLSAGTHGSATDRATLGAYDPLRGDRSTVLILDADYRLRKDSSGDWVDLRVQNLGNEDRQLDLRWRKPGAWTVTAAHQATTAYDPLTVSTAMLPIGSSTPTVTLTGLGAGSQEVTLRMQRSRNALSLSSWLSPQVEALLSLKSEARNGLRNFGAGWNCFSVASPNCLSSNGSTQGWGVLWLAEPIESRHNEVEARINFSADRLRVSTAFYASFFHNAYDTLTPVVPSSLLDPLGNVRPMSTGLSALLSNPIALAPSNRYQQWEASGSYQVTPTTQATLIASMGRSNQSEDFIGNGLSNAPAGVSNLAAQVDTSLIKLGVQSRPITGMTLNADVRSERRNDKTPLALYNIDGTGNSALTYTNAQISNLKTHSHVGASWQLGGPYKLALNADYEFIDRLPFTASSAVAGIGLLRQRTEELTVQAELRKRMAEGSSAAIALVSSRRDGSNWLRDVSGRGVAEITDATQLPATALYMPTLANRLRNSAKVFWDWQTTEALNVQISASGGRDRLDAPGAYGLRNTHVNDISVDWSYAASDNWNLSGYVYRGGQSFLQARPAGYIMAFDNANSGVGLQLSGKVNARWDIGAKFAYSRDDNSYGQAADVNASAYDTRLLSDTGGGLPNIVWQTSTINLFAKYNIDKRAAVRVDLAEQRATGNDWTWQAAGVPFRYSDGTVLTMPESQSAGTLSVRYIVQLP